MWESWQKLWDSCDTWRAWKVLYSSIRHDPSGGFWRDYLFDPALWQINRVRQPILKPYTILAKHYDEFAQHMTPEYGAFLAELSRIRRFPIRTVLDMACGTGIGTEELAAHFPEVIGLDASEHMLARACAKRFPSANVSFLHGDFCHFQLTREFDAAVCAFNSLNYAHDLSALRASFRCVAQHLRPGGLFTFDTVTRNYLSATSGRFYHLGVQGYSIALAHHYDIGASRAEIVVLSPSGVEIHRRIPIDPDEVSQVISGTGLELVELFIPESTPGYCFYVLTKSGEQ